MTVGEQIRTARIEAHVTQKQLGEKCGVSDYVVSTWENGRYIPRLDQAVIICQTLGTTLDYLVGTEEDVSESIRRFDFTCMALRRMLKSKDGEVG